MAVESAKEGKCLRCGSRMMPGYLRDSQGMGANPEPQTWLPQLPADSFFQRMAAKMTAATQEVPVVALRCLDCGHIELVASRWVAG